MTTEPRSPWTTVTIDTADDAARVPAGAVAPLEEARYLARPPLSHVAALDASGALRARCSIWRRQDEAGRDTRDGIIGHFAAEEVATGTPFDATAGWAVLEHACRLLRDAGCPRVIGPMDGNTWQTYRFVTDPMTEPPFFLEPNQPAAWPRLFVEFGFQPLAHYTSALNDDLTRTDSRTEATRETLRQAGVDIHPLDLSQLDDELVRLYDVSLVAFTDNLFYSPLPRDVFVTMYQPLRDHLVSDLVLLAERQGEVIGYIFGLPNLLEAQRGEPVRTAILKTMAVHPAWRGLGLGSALIDQCQRAARSLGFRQVIHALMHEDNRSRAISSHFGRTIRRYTLFAKDLASASPASPEASPS